MVLDATITDARDQAAMDAAVRAERRRKARSLVSSAASAWAPAEKPRFADWCEKHRVLGADSDRPGPWSNANVPYLVGLMDAINDPAVREVFAMKSSQTGFTELLINLIGYLIMHDPGPCMVIFKNEDRAREFNEKRVRPMILSVPALAAKVAGDLKRQSTAELVTDRMTVYFRGAGSNINIRSLPIRWVIIDDISSMEDPGAVIAEARQRMTTFAEAKMVCGGVPGEHGLGIHAEILASDRREYVCPCPACLEFQKIRFEAIKWEGGERADADFAAEHCELECANQHCKRRIKPHEKRWLVNAGVWIRDGDDARAFRDGDTPGPAPENYRDIERATPNGDRFIARVGGGRSSRRAGFSFSQEISLLVEWGAMVAEYIGYKGRLPEEFINGRLGRPFKVDTTELEAEHVRSLCRPVSRGGHRLGTVPDFVLALVMGVDVQHDRIWVCVDGYGPLGQESALVWCGEIPRKIGDGIWAVDQLARRGFPLASDPSKMIRPLLTFVDSGKWTSEVYECARRNAKLNVFAVKGDGNMREPVDETPIDLGGGDTIRLLRVNTLIYGDEVARSHRHSAGVEAAVRDASNAKGGDDEFIAGVIRASSRIRRLPEDCPPEYIDHVIAMERSISVSSRGSRPVWQRRQGHAAEHLRDAHLYAMAGADWQSVRQMDGSRKAQLHALAAPLDSLLGPQAGLTAPSPPASGSPNAAVHRPNLYSFPTSLRR